jgi:hypothetical protein
MSADLDYLYAHHAVGLCPEERCVTARANLAALVEGVTIGPIEHSNSMCQKDGCTCWCQACERHNWRHELEATVASREGSGT